MFSIWCGKPSSGEKHLYPGYQHWLTTAVHTGRWSPYTWKLSINFMIAPLSEIWGRTHYWSWLAARSVPLGNSWCACNKSCVTKGGVQRKRPNQPSWTVDLWNTRLCFREKPFPHKSHVCDLITKIVEIIMQKRSRISYSMNEDCNVKVGVYFVTPKNNVFHLTIDGNPNIMSKSA